VLSGKAPVGKLNDVLVYGNPAIVFAAFNEVATQIAVVLNKYSDDFAPYVLASGLAAMMAWMTLQNLGGFLGLLTLYGIGRFGLPRRSGYGLIYTLLGIVALTVLVYLATRLTMVGRYALLAACLILAVTAALVSRLADASEHEGRWRRWTRYAVFAGLAIGCAINIGARPDYKAYIRDAGLWIERELPHDVRVITNDYIIDYYAGRPHGAKLDSLDKVRAELRAATPPYYVALRLKDHEADEARALLGTAPVREFHSSRAAERLLIFHVERR
jgi:hypothetical protein